MVKCSEKLHSPVPAPVSTEGSWQEMCKVKEGLLFINTDKKSQSFWGKRGRKVFKAAFHMKGEERSSVRHKVLSGKRKAVIKGLSQCHSGIEREYTVQRSVVRGWFLPQFYNF